MKKIFSLLLSVLLIVSISAQDINYSALYPTLNAVTVNGIIAMKTSGDVTRVLTKTYTSTFIIDVLSGDIIGLDTNAVELITVLYGKDENTKNKVAANITYLKNKAIDKNLNPLLGTIVSGYSFDYTYQITGTLIAIWKVAEIAIVEYNGNLYKCNYYTIK